MCDADPPEHTFSMKSLERLGCCVSSTPLMEGKNLGYRTGGNCEMESTSAWLSAGAVQPLGIGMPPLGSLT
jgi:hypothetical protein